MLGVTDTFGDAYQVEVANVLESMKVINTNLDKLAVRAYTSGVKMPKSFPHRLLLKFSDANAEILNRFFTTVFADQAQQYFNRKDPDIYVTTYPVIGYALSRLMSKGRIATKPVITIVTDAGSVNKTWLLGKDDIILAPTEQTAELIVQKGVPAPRVKFLGFPVDPRISHLPDKIAARYQLGLNPKEPVVIFTAGGLGMSGKLDDLAHRLARHHQNAEFVFICGQNPRLLHKLREVKFSNSVQVLGYIQNMPLYLAAADLVVGKAGWVSLYEAMVAKKPTLIINVIPGHEEPNAAYVSENGVGRIVTDTSAAAEAIEDYLSHPEKLKSFDSHFTKLAVDGLAGERIAKFIASVIAKSANPKPVGKSK